jgi:hypothetical protein
LWGIFSLLWAKPSEGEKAMAQLKPFKENADRQLIQMSLFDNPISQIPLVVTVTSMALVSTIPDSKSSIHTLSDWQKVLALPLMVLAAVWSAYSREFKNQCIHVCGNRTTCPRQLIRNLEKRSDEEGCLLHAAYNIGLEWVYDNEEEYSTPLGLASEGGYQVMDI